MILTAGFVLGEAFGLLKIVAVEMALTVTLVFGLALLLCLIVEEAGAGEREKAIRQAEKVKSNSQAIRAYSRWLLLALFFLGGGILRGRQAVEWSRREQALLLDGERGTVFGTLCSVKKSGDYQILILEDCSVERRASFAEASEEKNEESHKLTRIQIYLKDKPLRELGRQPGAGNQSERELGPRLGARIRAEGEFRSFEGARNPGEFDYRLYYCSLGLNYRMFADSCQEVRAGRRWPRELLRRWSEYGSRMLEAVCDFRDAGIFRAAILGDKSGLDREIQKLYQRNGIAHLLAISGLHLSLISTAVYGSLRKAGTGYKRAGIFGGLILTGYAVMTGASPSVVRALIMVLCSFVAAWMGRTYDLFSAMGLAAILILWDNPYQLLQGGVQLSFGAVAAVGSLADMEREPGRGKFSEIFGAGMAMQLVTLPIILYHFFQIPAYGIFLNLLVVPLMGIVIASGAAGILLGSFCLPLGKFAAGSGHVILRVYECLCRVWDKLPGSNLILGRPALWQIWIYAGLLAAAGWLQKRGGRRRCLAFAAVALLFLLPLPVRGMEVTFLDVGQGDGICIRASTRTILVDGGSTDQKGLGENRLEPFLKSRGISAIDFAIVSHGDQDHISGLVYLMEESPIRIKCLVLPAAGRGDEAYDRLEYLAGTRDCPVLWMGRGDRISMGKLDIYCQYPEKEDRADDEPKAVKDRNEHSLVLQVSYGDFYMLLTGDMSKEGEERLLAMEAEQEKEHTEESLKNIQVLKVAHHGSPYSTTRSWIETLKPRWAVISYGKDNSYGHPGKEVLKALSENNVQILETAKCGAVILRTDGHKKLIISIFKQ